MQQNAQLLDTCYAIVDCNNFYVSCERAVDHTLEGRVVVVLSSNDGCVISRSEEAKAVGIPMGAPLFKFQKLLKEHNAAIISANFSEYEALSSKVMDILEEYVPTVEVYSIDEAWMELTGMFRYVDGMALMEEIRQQIWQRMHIPVSIGIAPTKVLAKVANKRAKKLKTTYVESLMEVKSRHIVLKKTAIETIWGIGGRSTKKLLAQRVETAWDFMQLSPEHIQKQFHLPGLRLWKELHGEKAIGLDLDEKAAKTVMVSRSFGADITEYAELEAAMITFILKACRKLTEHNRMAGVVTVFVRSNSHKEHMAQHNESRSVHLETHSDFPPVLIAAARGVLRDIVRPEIAYKKLGILLTDLYAPEALPIPLFGQEAYLRERSLKRVLKNLPKVGWATGLAATKRKKWHPQSQYISNLTANNSIEKTKRRTKLWW
jgi:DNA polymerase V